MSIAETTRFGAGGYRYIRAAFQYSSGVAAEPGFQLERAQFLRPPLLADGFAAAEAHLRAIGRPPAAFAACELRSAAPFTDQGFIDFNREYVKTLERWGIYRAGINPVARTNVCPEHNKPAQPVLYAFSYTMPAGTPDRGSFVIAGGGDAHPGEGDYRDRIVRYGDTSADAMREKIRHVVKTMESRLAALGFSWRDAVCTRAYTVQDIGALMEAEIVRPGAAANGLRWHFARPPVAGLEFEMDVYGTRKEIIL